LSFDGADQDSPILFLVSALARTSCGVEGGLTVLSPLFSTLIVIFSSIKFCIGLLLISDDCSVAIAVIT
jgi:hypothetical protein